MNLSKRLLYSSGFRFLICIVSILTRLYKSGNRQKLSHTTGSACNTDRISRSITNPSTDMSGNTARPASVINPSRSILRHLSLFSSDQLLRGFRGHNFCTVISSAILLVVLSIQPKHMASSTASMYQNVPSSLGLPRLTTTQHSVSVLWFCASHLRNYTLDLTFNRLFTSIAYIHYFF